MAKTIFLKESKVGSNEIVYVKGHGKFITNHSYLVVNKQYLFLSI